MNNSNIAAQANAVAVQNVLIKKVYLWMSMALATTAMAAYLVASTPALINMLLANRFAFFILLFAELGLVIFISARINKLSFNTALGLFILYSVLNGVTLSVIFLLYTAASLTSTFLVTAGTFAVMSIYGYVTKRNLTSMGNIAMMLLIGVVIASVVNLFMNSSTLYWIVTYVGVLVFVGLTAYDTQKIKRLATMEDSEQTRKLAIVGALTLYLDFINLFLLMLRLLGGRK